MRLFVLLAITLGLFSWLARPLVRNQVPIEHDLGRYHLPHRDFYQKCLTNGDDPAWCPHLFCGYDCHGEGQGGFDHPWHRLLYSTLPLTIAFNIEIFANYPLLFAGIILLLRRHAMPRDAAVAGAIAATFSGFTLPHYVHTNAIAIVAHIPWLLWATDIAWRDNDALKCAGSGLLIALFTGSQILLGYPQYVYFSCVAEGVYILCLFFSSPSPPGFARGEGGVRGVEPPPPSRWLLLPTSCIWKLLGIAVGGAQLLPSWQALQLSPRLGYDRHFREMLSLPPEMLLQTIAPTLFKEGMQHHEYAVYGGALATLGLAWFAFFSLSSRALTGDSCGVRGAWLGGTLNQWACWMFVIAVPLALGKYTPLFKLYLKLPVVGVFRCPCRYLVLSHLASAVIVARLVQNLGSGRVQPNRRVWLLLIIPVMSVVAAIMEPYWPSMLHDDSRKFLTTDHVVWIGSVVLVAATLLCIAVTYRLPGALSLLLIIGLVDQGIWGFRAINVHTFADIETYRKAQNPPPGDPPGRVVIGDAAGNGLMLLGWSYTNGYVGLTPPRALDYHLDETLSLAATQWRIDDKSWHRFPGQPRMRSVPEGGELSPIADRPGNIKISAKLPTPQTVVVAESFHPSWKVMVDDQPAELLRADTDFIGVNVSPGEHRIAFQFEPEYRMWGRRLSYSAVIIAFTLALWMASRKRSTMKEHT